MAEFASAVVGLAAVGAKVGNTLYGPLSSSVCEKKKKIIWPAGFTARGSGHSTLASRRRQKTHVADSGMLGLDHVLMDMLSRGRHVCDFRFLVD
jgi:hypothetical protein